jgi:hypothetical protein
MSVYGWRKLFCLLSRRHFWHDYQVARRCTWCGKIEVRR